jgi:hypothetical protein
LKPAVRGIGRYSEKLSQFKPMGEYPYDCAICGGAYERCANENGGGYNSDSEEEGCECGGEGGQFCWENSVVCKVVKVVIGDPEEKDIEGLQTLKEGDILEGGEYSGSGTVLLLDRFGEFQIIIDEEYQYSFKNYALVKVWCASCYNEAKRKGKL